jgi:hypothetical protein
VKPINFQFRPRNRNSQAHVFLLSKNHILLGCITALFKGNYPNLFVPIKAALASHTASISTGKESVYIKSSRKKSFVPNAYLWN